MTRLTALVFALLLFVTACSSGSTTTSTLPASSATSAGSTATAATGPTVTISGMRFGPPLTVAPGATVTVVNNDSAEHSVTADSGGAFDAEVDGSGTITFTAPSAPGSYAYHCKYHPMMHGQLVVQ